MSPFLSRNVVKPPYSRSVACVIQKGMMLSTSSLRKLSLSCFIRRFVIPSSRVEAVLRSAYPLSMNRRNGLFGEFSQIDRRLVIR